MGLEVIDRELEDHFQLLQLKVTPASCGVYRGSFVVVAQQMLVIGGTAARHCRSQQMLRQYHLCAHAGAEQTMVTLANAVESVAGRHHPCVGKRTVQVFSKILEYGGMFRGNGGKVIEGFVDACSQAGGGDVVTEDALVDNVGEEARLRYQFVQQVRNIFLAFGREGLLIASATSERDHDRLAFSPGDFATHQGTCAEQRAAQAQARCVAQEVASAATELAGELLAGAQVVSDFVFAAAVLGH